MLYFYNQIQHLGFWKEFLRVSIYQFVKINPGKEIKEPLVRGVP